MGAIDPNDLAYLHLLEAAAGGTSLLEYVPRVTPQWEVPWHLRHVAQLFARAEFEEVRACVSVPPRHGKTELLLHAIAWWLERHPEQDVVYLSYGGDFAREKSRRAREIAWRAGLDLSRSQSRADSWRTSAGGGVRATGIRGALTGHPANLMIIDDPVKNREDAESATMRERNWDWFTSTAMTRVEPGGSVIVVHTRWHDDDMIGRLAREKNWEVVNLPALAEDDDPIGRSNGEALWPQRWSRKALTNRRREVGEYDWASMFQGQPRPRGGRLFKEPTYYEVPNIDAVPLIVCDPAATSRNYSDYSAIVVGLGWVDEEGLIRVDIVDVMRAQVEIPALVGYLDQMQQKWQAKVAIEAVGGFKAVPQMLRQINKNVRIVELVASTDKFTRSLPASAAWNDGRIRIPKGTKSWVSPFLHEVMQFTGVQDVHDDQVDALAHLYTTFTKMLPRKGLGIRHAPGAYL